MCWVILCKIVYRVKNFIERRASEGREGAICDEAAAGMGSIWAPWGAVGGAPGSLRAWLWLAEARCTRDASISGPTLACARVGRRPSAILISGLLFAVWRVFLVLDCTGAPYFPPYDAP